MHHGKQWLTPSAACPSGPEVHGSTKFPMWAMKTCCVLHSLHGTKQSNHYSRSLGHFDANTPTRRTTNTRTVPRTLVTNAVMKGSMVRAVSIGYLHLYLSKRIGRN